MLPAAARLRTAADFTAAARRGRRGSSGTLVVHLLRTDRGGAPRAGFVVSKKVGNSVIRHRVTRRLRPLVRAHLAELPSGCDVVVRALPAAGPASSATFAVDLARALREASRRAGIAARDGDGNPSGHVTPAGSAPRRQPVEARS